MRIQEVFKDVGSMLVIDTKKFSKQVHLDNSIYNESVSTDLSKGFVNEVSAGRSTEEGRLAHLDRLEADNLRKLDSASNLRTSSDTLSLLAFDKFIRIRACVAANPNTRIDTLIQLAKDPSFEVLLRVAGNTNTPVDVLSILAQHKNSEVRMRVARNSNTNQQTLSELLLDEDFRVRSSVCTNINRQSQQFKHHASSQYSVIQDCKQTTESTQGITDRLYPLAVDKDPIVRGGVAHNPNTPLKILVQLATDNCSLVRRNVAGNVNADKNLLKDLALDSDDTVRSAVAANANTSSKVLSNLILDDVRAVRVGVMINPGATDEIKSLVRLMELKRAAEIGEQENRSLQIRTVRGLQHWKNLSSHVTGYLMSSKTRFSSLTKTLSPAVVRTQFTNSMLGLYRSMSGRLKKIPALNALPRLQNKETLQGKVKNKKLSVTKSQKDSA